MRALAWRTLCANAAFGSSWSPYCGSGAVLSCHRETSTLIAKRGFSGRMYHPFSSRCSLLTPPLLLPHSYAVGRHGGLAATAVEKADGAPDTASDAPSPHGLINAFQLTLPMGRCVGIVIPPELDAPGISAAGAELLPEELDFCLQLPLPMRATFLGGRVAMRRALGALSGQVGPILRNPYGAPVLPPGMSGSISHKRHVAVALLRVGDGPHLGMLEGRAKS
ncbi:unnamed protein product [Phaeothamnion confervicola]